MFHNFALYQVPKKIKTTYSIFKDDMLHRVCIPLISTFRLLAYHWYQFLDNYVYVAILFVQTYLSWSIHVKQSPTSLTSPKHNSHLTFSKEPFKSLKVP